MVSLNETLADEYLDRQITLEQLKKGEVRAIRRLLKDDLIPDIRSRLATRLKRIRSRGYDKGPWTTKAMIRLEREMKSVSRAALKRLGQSQAERMVEVAKLESKWLTGVLDGELGPFGVTIGKPTVSTLRNAALTNPFDGMVLKDWYDDLGSKTAQKVMRQVRVGIAQGESSIKIARRLEGPLNTTLNNAEAIARTSIQHVSAQARNRVAIENEDLVKHEVWTATLDDRTSLICIDLDGNVYPVGEGIFPPAHYRCRSWRRMELKNFRELGIKGVKDVEVTGIDGKPVGSTTYRDWLARQPKKKQIEILGKQRAEMFREDPSIVGKFTDDQLRPRTLEELADVQSS